MPVKFMFTRKTTKIDKIFTVDLTLCSKCEMPKVVDPTSSSNTYFFVSLTYLY